MPLIRYYKSNFQCVKYNQYNLLESVTKWSWKYLTFNGQVAGSLLCVCLTCVFSGILHSNTADDKSENSIFICDVIFESVEDFQFVLVPADSSLRIRVLACQFHLGLLLLACQVLQFVNPVICHLTNQTAMQCTDVFISFDWQQKYKEYIVTSPRSSTLC